MIRRESEFVGQAGRVALIVVVAIALSGCGFLRKISGSNKNPPDEFKVVSKPPLVMPPDYNLKPPRPGEPEAQNLQATVRLDQALFEGEATLPPPASPGEQALIELVRQGGRVSPNVRSNVGDDTIVVEKGSLLNDILSTEERVGSPDGSSVERVRSESVRSGSSN